MEFIVKIDKELSVANTSSLFETRTITIDFEDFLENVCIMQSREFNPSNYVNLNEFIYIRSWISSFFPLSFYQVEGRVEDKTVLSENVGVGLAMCSIEKLWGKVEFMKINTTVKRPDFTAILENGDRLIIESKGTGQIDSKAIVDAFKKAYVQKNVDIGKGFFERIISVTHLVYDGSSVVYLLDPPTDEPKKATVNERMSAKAYSYSKLFSVYGFPEISRYFHLLSKRYIEKTFNSTLLNEKINLLEKILNQHSYNYNNRIYYGQIRKIDDKNIFLGIDEDLLYLETFLTFEESKKESIVNDKFKLEFSRKGFIRIEFNNPADLGWDIDTDKIINNYNYLTISDIDDMSGISLEKFISYKFIENGYSITTNQDIKDYADLIVSDKNTDEVYYIEIKKFFKKNYFEIPNFNKHFSQKFNKNKKKTILITNAIIDKELYSKLFTNNNLIVWDREILKKIIKRKKISNFLNSKI